MMQYIGKVRLAKAREMRWRKRAQRAQEHARRAALQSLRLGDLALERDNLLHEVGQLRGAIEGLKYELYGDCEL